MFDSTAQFLKERTTLVNDYADQIKGIQNKNETLISKLMTMGGYSRKDIITNVASHLKTNNVVFNETNPEHWNFITAFLQGAIITRAVKISSKEGLLDFYISEVNADVFVYTDFQKTLVGVDSKLPLEINNLIKVLS